MGKERRGREGEGKMMDQGRNIHNPSLWMRVECRGSESHPRQLIFLTASGVLCCFALLASFFLPSHLSLKHALHYINTASCLSEM